MGQAKEGFLCKPESRREGCTFLHRCFGQGVKADFRRDRRFSVFFSAPDGGLACGTTGRNLVRLTTPGIQTKGTG
jgi:hypothetical protein